MIIIKKATEKYLSVAAASVWGKTCPDELTPRIRKKRTKFGRHTE